MGLLVKDPVDKFIDVDLLFLVFGLDLADGLQFLQHTAAGTDRFADLPVVSNMQDVAKYICREWIDEVYIAVENFDGFPRDLLEKCRQMGNVRLVSFE